MKYVVFIFLDCADELGFNVGDFAALTVASSAWVLTSYFRYLLLRYFICNYNILEVFGVYVKP